MSELAIAVHELAHCAIEFAHRPTSKVSIVAKGAYFEIECEPPLSAEHALAGMLGGVIGELLFKCSLRPELAVLAVKSVGWEIALSSKIGKSDLELVGPALTDEIVIGVIGEYGTAIADFIRGVDLKLLGDSLENLIEGTKISVKSKALVH